MFKGYLKAPRLSGSPMGVPLVLATGLRAEEPLLATEITKSVVMRWLSLRTSRVQERVF